ncbi:MAG: glycosyltransferase family 4 protein [Candidatus Tectomicrobia bacterium]|uniref:Glycosyltransferase family 4 protein n=1 Tax=Tectimicrobiota bacterium TaxID=2528274 RepID=A0A932ZUK3_UNCTE|nr:glycosyltransferase family 4 protein [Candidatus Tectomicrobia bacterium]
MRVLHIITRLDRGGSADNTLLSCIGQRRRGHEVVLAAGPGLTEESPLRPEAESEGVLLVRIPSLIRAVHPVKDAVALRACWRLIRGGRFDLVHTHTSKAGILGRLAARLAGGCRVVHTPHGHVFYGYFGPWKTRLFIWAERLMARWTDAIVTLTDREAEEHLALGVGRPSQFVTIFSGIPLPGPKARAGTGPSRRRALGLPAEGALVGSVGRLDPIKGHGLLIQAFALLGDRHPGARLILIGEGEKREEYQALARELGVAEGVRFMGWRDDVGDLLEELDLFAFPSRNEGMGRAAVEAMAAGLAVVAARTGGLPEVVREEETGLLVPPGDAAALSAAIGRLLARPEERRAMGEAGRRLAQAYSAERMCEKIEALYQRLLAPTAPGFAG